MLSAWYIWESSPCLDLAVLLWWIVNISTISVQRWEHFSVRYYGILWNTWIFNLNLLNCTIEALKSMLELQIKLKLLSWDIFWSNWELIEILAIEYAITFVSILERTLLSFVGYRKAWYWKENHLLIKFARRQPNVRIFRSICLGNSQLATESQLVPSTLPSGVYDLSW